MRSHSSNPDGGSSSLSTAEIALVEAIRGIDFGSVEVTVHEGRVVQIESRRKVRFPSAPQGARGLASDSRNILPTSPLEVLKNGSLSPHKTQHDEV